MAIEIEVTLNTDRGSWLIELGRELLARMKSWVRKQSPRNFSKKMVGHYQRELLRLFRIAHREGPHSEEMRPSSTWGS